MPAGRFKPKPQRQRAANVTTDHPSRETVTHSERRQIAHEARGGDQYAGVKRAAAAVGTAAVRGGRAVKRGAERDVALVNSEAEAERAALAKRAAKGDAQALRTLVARYGQESHGIRHGLGPLAPLVDAARHPLREAKDFYDFSSQPGPHKYERTTDVVAGKSLSNLLFHGDTSHLPEAALEAGSLIPIGRGARFGAEAILGADDALRIAAREQAAKEAGRVVSPAERLRKAETEADTLLALQRGEEPSAGSKVAKGLGAHRVGRAAQDQAASAERASRFGNFEAEFGKAGGGAAGLRAGLGQMKGELPKINVTALSDGTFSQADFDEAVNAIMSHPDLMTGQKLHAAYGLKDAFENGRALQPSQIKLLQTVFGQDQVKEIGKLAKGKHLAVEVLNIPRSLMASFDVSAPLRQGLVGMARHPILGAKNFPTMFKALASENSYQGIVRRIHNDPNYQKMLDSGLKFTELGADLGTREEPFIAEGLLAHPVKVGKANVNLVGRGVHASGRAYTGFLDAMRADMFNQQLKLAQKAGVNIEDRRQLRGIANFVNTATGRGGLGPIESWAPALNALFFSPRLAMSRINMMNPVWYAKLTPFARRQAIRSMVQLGAAATATLAAGSYFLNGKVALDPRNTDFAKLKMGNTRADVLGGFQQYIRVASQLTPTKFYGGGSWQGAKINSAGNLQRLGSGFGQTSDWDVFQNFVQGKASPTASLFVDALKGTAFGNQPLTVQHEIATRMIPLIAQDAYAIYKDKDSVTNALIGYGIGSFGVGIQNYKDTSQQKKQTNYKTWYAGVKKELGYVPQELIRTYQARQLVTDLEDKRKGELGIVGFNDSHNPRRDLELKREHANIVIDALVRSYPSYGQYADKWRADVNRTPASLMNGLIDTLRSLLDPSGEWKAVGNVKSSG